MLDSITISIIHLDLPRAAGILDGLGVAGDVSEDIEAAENDV